MSDSGVIQSNLEDLYSKAKTYFGNGELENAYRDVAELLRLSPGHAPGVELMQSVLHQAQQRRDEQGSSCEMEVVLATGSRHEATPRQLYDQCTKHPGHRGFIPVSKLKLEHLPEGCQSDGVLNYVRSLAQHAVKLIVTSTSKDRPQHMQWVTQMRSGTGHIRPFGEEEEFRVDTAAHVVFNDEEAKRTEVELFFHDENDRSEVVYAHGERMFFSSVGTDSSSIIVRLDDPGQYPDVIARLNSHEDMSTPSASFTCAVSHPHGVSAKITFGTVVNIKPCDFEGKKSTDKLAHLMFELTSVLTVAETTCLCFLLYCEVYGKDIWRDPSTHREVRRAVIQHLFNKDMLSFPTDGEMEKMLKVLLLHGMEVNPDLIEQIRIDRRDISGGVASHKKDSSLSATSHDLVRSQSHVDSPTTREDFFNNFAEHWKTVKKEIMYKGRELYFGKGQADQVIEDISMRYDLDTCPGSSGSQVTCFVVEEGGQEGQGRGCQGVQHLVPHSRGKAGGPGRSGAGVTYPIQPQFGLN